MDYLYFALSFLGSIGIFAIVFLILQKLEL